jgi:hypothetical protein
MAGQSWIEFLIQWGIWAVVVLAVMGWLGRSRLRAGTLQPDEMRMPWGILVLGVLCFLLFSGGVIFQIVVPNPTVTVWTILAFAGFTCLSLPIISSFFLETHHLSDDSIDFRNLLGVRKNLRWRDLKSVRYASNMRWFRLETHDGTVARVSINLKGLPEFARLLLHKAPRDAIDPATLPVLQQTAAGHPPSIY